MYCDWNNLDNSDINKIRQDLINSFTNEDARDRICDICHESFLYVKCLVDHLRFVHGISRPFECPYCDRDFSQRFALNCHVRKQHGPNLVVTCAHCSFSTLDRDKLENHIRRLHFNDPPPKSQQTKKTDEDASVLEILKNDSIGDSFMPVKQPSLDVGCQYLVRRSKKLPVKEKIEKPKIKYGKYTQENLRQALNAVGEGLSLRSASEKFKVPFSTLRGKHVGIYAMGVKSGPPPVLSEPEEQSLANWILSMKDRGFHVTKNMILDSLQIYLKAIKKKNSFPNDRPTKSWLLRYLKRHASLSEITLESLRDKTDKLTEQEIRDWFEKTKRYLRSKKLLDIDPTRVFSCDEVAFYLNPADYRIVVDRKHKLVKNVLNFGDNENLVTLFTGDAAGHMVPPMVVYPHNRLPAKITELDPGEYAVEKSDDGWVDGLSFYNYITKTFIKWCHDTDVEFPIVLYVDALKCHVTRSLYEFCEGNKIELIPYCPSASDVIYLALYANLEYYWALNVNKWRKRTSNKSLKKTDFIPVLKSTLRQINVKSKLVEGFELAGLYPLDVDAVDFTKL